MLRFTTNISILVALCAVSSRAHAQGFAPTFQRVDLLAGQSPLAVAMGDLDDDGDDDLIVGSGGTLRVLLADGVGGFAPALSFSQGGLDMEDIAVGDVDGDGALDVVGIDRPAETVGVLLGNGAGALGGALLKPVGLSLAQYEIGIAIGDLNADTRGDVVLTGASQNAALVLQSTGAGALANPLSIPAGVQPSDVAIGDLNGDTIPDLVLTNSQGIAVLLGTGGGAFAASSSTLFTGGTFKLALGDFNSDGLDDVCATRRSVASFAVLRSSGGGAFAPATHFTLPALGQELRIVDVSRDGALDIAVEVIVATNSVHIFLGNGVGGFSASTITSLPAQPYRMASGDIDADLGPELAVAFNTFGGGVSVLQNQTPASTAGFAHCAGKINSLGCVPTMSATGASSVSASSGFVLSASQVRNQRAGLLLYGLNGPGSAPYLGGNLCVRTPLRRTPAQTSGGSSASINDCSGVFALDLNAFASGAVGGTPAPELSVVGAEIACQYWSRDSGASFNVSLSNGWLYGVGL